MDGHYNVRIPNKLAPFDKDVIELRSRGRVNKIKVIKWIMYGQNGFELLKAKVLLHEQFCFSNN